MSDKKKHEQQIERRAFDFKEVRLAGEDGDIKIVGYAAVFNSLSDDLGGFVERIRPGTFVKTIDENDIRALFNHDKNYVLGRNKAGTLTLAEDEVGLRFEIEPPDTQYARDLVASIKRGDVDQGSFGFETIRDEWEQVEDLIVRTLIEVKLFDISPVTFPAYPQTSAQVRSRLDEFKQDPSAAPGQEAHPADEGDEEHLRDDPEEQERDDPQARNRMLHRRLDLAERS